MKELSDFFDQAVALAASAKVPVNWLIGPIVAHLQESKLDFSQTKITPQNIIDLASTMGDGTINSTTAKQLLIGLLSNAADVRKLISDRGLGQICDEAGLKDSISKILTAYPEQLADFRKGKTKVR
jgi:aspartyl-tRNA(Asn)/glutamyl-tRNA(Gln) amidotransferase subunit B